MADNQADAGAIEVNGIAIELLCQVCINNLRRSDYPICDSCFQFFENSVKNISIVFCSYSGRCDVRLANINRCNFCRLSRCYSLGMRSSMVNVDMNAYLELRNLRMNQPVPQPLIPFRLRWETAQYLICMLYMEQYYYQWLYLSTQYQALSIENKKRLRERSFYRGTALQLIERSYVVHDVLWLHNSFYDPYTCDQSNIRPSAVMFLTTIFDFRNSNITVEEFLSMKLKLALMDDVETAVDANIGQNIYDAITNIANQLQLCHINRDIIFRNSEEPRLISQIQLFKYLIAPGEFSLPEHRILINQ